MLLPHVSLATPETPAARLARLAQSPAVQALVGQAPPLTRDQLATVRAAFRSAAPAATAVAA